MLDTVKLESPPLDEGVAGRIENMLVRRSGVDMASGELLYEITAGDLEGSWDHRIAVRVLRERLVVPPGQKMPQLVASAPYVVLEGSIHKAMLGHNVYGGPEGLQEACAWFVDDFGIRVGVGLPKASRWLVRRIDWAEAYQLPDFESVQEYVWGLNSAEYPRRSVARYGRESIFAPGRTTAVKAYHKGVEFSKHDAKRLRLALGKGPAAELQWYANQVLRWEVSVKAKKLDTDHGGKPRVQDVSDDWIRSLHYREVRRLIREGDSDVKTVRKQKDVRDRLISFYDARKAGLLLGTWHQLVTLGEAETRKHIADRTWYRHIRLLKEAGVSWVGSDVVVVSHSSIPEDFSIGPQSPYRLAGEAPEIAAALAPYRAA